MENEHFDQLKKKAEQSGVKHKFVHQIHIDVERSLNSIDFFSNLTDKEIKYHRDNLEDLLQTFFTLYPNYSYYQGFHDVGTILLYTLGKDGAFRAMQRLAYFYFRDALKYPFDQSVTLQLRLILRIVHVFDPWFADTVSSFYEGVPIFSVPWVLTWFSHSLKDMKTIQRIFDFLISSPPYSIIYMCAAVLLVMKKELLGRTQDIDMAIVHSFFQHLEVNNVELLLSTTIELERKCNIYKLFSDLEKPFPDQSALMYAKHWAMVNKYYKHSLREQASVYAKPEGKSHNHARRQIFASLGVATIVVILTLVSRKLVLEQGGHNVSV